MTELIALITAIGFWGWIALVFCTAIICEAWVKVSRLRLQRYELELKILEERRRRADDAD